MTSPDGVSIDAPRRAGPTFRQALFVAVTAGLGYGFDSYAVNIYGLVLPEIKKTKHITDAQAGLTTNVAAFTGLRFLTGVGGAGELAVGAPYTAEVWPTRTRAIGVGGVIFSLFSLGYVLAAAVALALVPHFGWQAAFVVAIVPAIILFLTTYVVARFHATSFETIRYALVFFELQAVFVYLATALADWVGRRPSAILAALVEIGSTILAVTSDDRSEYLADAWCP